MFIPFDPNGNIQPGIHYYTYEMFKKQFVEDIAASRTRLEIHHLSFLWLAELERIVTPVEVWFDGEFVTASADPSEINLCVFLLRNSIQRERVTTCLDLTHLARAKYKCNAYYGIMNEDRTVGSIGPYYWTEQFGFDASNIPKGIVVLPWEEVSTALK